VRLSPCLIISRSVKRPIPRMLKRVFGLLSTDARHHDMSYYPITST
jgi:hypothetical protein